MLENFIKLAVISNINMEIDTAETLLHELVRHGRIFIPEKKKYMDILVSADVPDSGFFEALPDNKQVLQEYKRYHNLYLRRILRNSNAEKSHTSILNRICHEIGAELGYSSVDMVNKILADSNLVSMMSECREPYSLLGKIQTFDHDHPDDRMYEVTRPVLVIPNAGNMDYIHKWEESNIECNKTFNLFGLFPINVRVNPQEYFSL